MALSALTAWEVRTTGSDSACSGGFVAGASGTDFSQQNAAQYTGTDLVIDATLATKVTSATHSFVTADVGNILRITAGTGFTVGFYQIVSVATGVATLDRVAGTLSSTGGTYLVGGCFASPGQAGSVHVNGNDLFIKSGTYTVTSATANVSGGCLSWLAPAASANGANVFGYGATRGDGGTRPIIIADGVITAFTLVLMGTAAHVENVTANGNSRTSSTCFQTGNAVVVKCLAKNATAIGFNGGWLLLCEATGCVSTVAMVASSAFWCWSHDNTGIGMSSGITSHSISSNNTGNGFDGNYGVNTFMNCTSFGNGGSGFNLQAGAGSAGYSMANNLAYGNGAYGVSMSAAIDTMYLYNCAFGSNTSGATSNVTAANNVGAVTLSANPFISSGTNNFGLNATSGGGLSCRAGSVAGAFPGGLTTGYSDIGAVQHQDAGGGAVGTPAYASVG